VILLVPYPIKLGRKQGRHNPRLYVSAMGFAARRRGALLTTTAGDKVRAWVSEAGARVALERDYPGEAIQTNEMEAPNGSC
jgi:hypothetical protein